MDFALKSIICCAYRFMGLLRLQASMYDLATALVFRSGHSRFTKNTQNLGDILNSRKAVSDWSNHWGSEGRQGCVQL